MRPVSKVLAFMLVLFLSACGGTLSISFDTTETPGPDDILEKTAPGTATLQPGPLDITSDSETIRLALLDSHEHWQTLYANGEVRWYAPEGNTTQTFHNQLWADRLASRFRSLVGPADGQPEAVQVSDGTSLLNGKFPEGQWQVSPLPPFASNPAWAAPREVTDTITPYPLDMAIDSPISQMIFTTALAQRGGAYTPVALESVAGRSALVAEWGVNGAMQDRFWIDVETGVILRWENFVKGGSDRPASEMVLDTILYDQNMVPALFDLQLKERPQFALDISGVTAPTPQPPPAVFQPEEGALYFTVDDTPNPLQLMRLPESCITGSAPCPAPQAVEGYPNRENTVYPLAWAPEKAPVADQAALVQMGTLYRYLPATSAWTALAQYPIIREEVAWSSNGMWLAFVVQMADEQQDLYAVRSSGAGLVNLTNGRFQGQGINLAVDGFLLDGRVLFKVITPDAAQPYTVRIPEDSRPAEAKVVPNASLRRGVIALAPDREQVAFSDQQDNGVRLNIVGLDLNVTTGELAGSVVKQNDPRRIATFQNASIQQILWSPDGQSIAFLVISGGGAADSGAENGSANHAVTTLYTIRADGTDLRQLFQTPDITRVVFTRTGQFLVAEGAPMGRLTVIPLDSSAPRTLEIPGLRLDQRVLGISWQ